MQVNETFTEKSPNEPKRFIGPKVCKNKLWSKNRKTIFRTKNPLRIFRSSKETFCRAKSWGNQD